MEEVGGNCDEVGFHIIFGVVPYCYCFCCSISRIQDSN